MIAGIGGASLGTEILKSLQLSGRYEVFGCDISSTAYGLYEPNFVATYRVDSIDYINSVIKACNAAGANWLIPGGEQPLHLLFKASERLAKEGIKLISNAPEVIETCSDKSVTFEKLKKLNVPIPKTAIASNEGDIEYVGLPCIVKPATGSGGSVAVFFALSSDEAMIYADFIRRSGDKPIVQEYIDLKEGEFTIGVLSLPNSTIAGSIALRRSLDAKLSIAYRGRGGIVSSGYSQGYIDNYNDICLQAENIARAINNRGPANIQGRVRKGVFFPFEINARFSASTYLRALAGFNEVDMFIDYLSSGLPPQKPVIRNGWYLRSLTETFVAEDQLK